MSPEVETWTWMPFRAKYSFSGSQRMERWCSVRQCLCSPVSSLLSVCLFLFFFLFSSGRLQAFRLVRLLEDGAVQHGDPGGADCRSLRDHLVELLALQRGRVPVRRVDDLGLAPRPEDGAPQGLRVRDGLGSSKLVERRLLRNCTAQPGASSRCSASSTSSPLALPSDASPGSSKPRPLVKATALTARPPFRAFRGLPVHSGSKQLRRNNASKRKHAQLSRCNHACTVEMRENAEKMVPAVHTAPIAPL